MVPAQDVEQGSRAKDRRAAIAIAHAIDRILWSTGRNSR
jgi:hypothetical protein